MKFDIFEYTSKGGRSYNEDAVGYKTEGGRGIFVVADGLGGHLLGEVASASARDTVIGGWKADTEDRAAWLSEIIETANSNILTIRNERNKTLKSTAVVLAVDETKAVWAHVGDSRLYYLHDDEIAAITEDHSVAYKKYKAGEITRAQIATDEDQSSLLRTLGNEDRHTPQIREWEKEIVPGDAFLLCSDGVWEYIRDTEVLIDFLKAKNAKHWAELMLTRMMGRIEGENDNLTILTLMIG